jgi:hypothetical protein
LTELRQNISESPITELNVWILNSLAGGTGSGALPLIAGLINKLLSKVEAEQQIETTLRGVGSVLRLDHLAETPIIPEHPPSHYLNAYTALADVQTLVSEEPATISLHPDASLFTQEELDGGDTVDQYLFVGVHDQQWDHLNALGSARS